MNAKELLLEQFTVSYDHNGWFVAVKNALVGLTAEQAAWKPEGADNCIREILAHLNYYNRAYLQRFKGIDYKYTISSNDESFAGSENVSEEAWQAEIAEFNTIMDGWREQLEAAPEERFAELYPPKNESAWASYITQINMHNAHHGGQIVLLRKLQGSWDRAKGVS